MANVYVWSGATGAGTGADWANAYTALQTATAAKAAGDVFFIAHDHVQTQASALTITSPGTEISPCRFYCVNRAGSVPPVSADLRTTAQILTTGASALTIGGTIADCYGVIFSAGDGANSASLNLNATASRTVRLTSCALRVLGTNAASRINWCSGAGANITICENTTMQFSAAGQLMVALGRCIWRNTPNAIAGAIFPVNLFSYSGGGSWFLEGIDLSGMASRTLMISTGNNPVSTAMFKDCKLGTSTILSGIPNNSWGQLEVIMVRCDNSDTNYRTEKYNYTGSQVIETTIVRTGGASDGITPISWKVVTSANSRWEMPFDMLPIVVWNEVVGSPVTITIQGIWGTASVPKNDDIWISAEYLGTSGFPLGVVAHSTKSDGLAVNADTLAGSGTWGGSTTKFAMSVTITPQKRGPITIYVRVAKASSTFYIDPKPVIT